MTDATFSSAVHWSVPGSEAQGLEAAAAELRTAEAFVAELARVRRPSLSIAHEIVRLTLRTLDYDDATDAVETGQLDLLVRGRVVVVAHRPPVEGDVRPLPARTPAGPEAVTALCRWVVAGYEAVCAELFVDIEEVEESVFSEVQTSDAERIYTLKREVAEVRRAVMPLVTPLEELAREDLHPDAELVHALEQLGDRLHRLAESVDTLDTLLRSVFDAHVARISMRQNEDMRRISAAAALVVVPTLVAGVYGMNFEHMPELGWTYGYPLVLALMGAVVAGLYVSFKRSGWL
ncbi:magnesium transporter CorA [Nocardioides sp. Y6]|uniref:Magnesium transporter CorA n=1 Tax=Nocardioides malaquae TaxID=2773426 RepID=A0ABR9RS84_9ACTN|nr:CorA family divalent cation transporter [Nocardioides malaquae]MBE7324433.1 magnesium transporter CorA [Nocardioides malaquae]